MEGRSVAARAVDPADDRVVERFNYLNRRNHVSIVA